MEDVLVTTLAADAELLAVFDPRPPEQWLFQASSLGEGDNPSVPEFPYIVWNELPSTPFTEMRKESNAEMRAFTIYVYDLKGDFTRINQILSIVRRITKEMVPFVSGAVRCLDSVWGGMSGLITDDRYDSNVRFGTVRFKVNS